MNPALLLSLTIEPVLIWLAAMGVRSDDRAKVMLLAIAGQESGFKYRRQVPVAHAMGLWQFERGGGVRGVLAHPITKDHSLLICRQLLVPAKEAEVHSAMEQNDLLACAFARLLLLSDPRSLPAERDAGWEYYLRNWRPGKPKPESWAGHWKVAVDLLKP